MNNFNNISCTSCGEKLKNFKNIIIHYIMHKYICPFCQSYYRSYKQFYDRNGHFNLAKCKKSQNSIITNNEKREKFYKKLEVITGEKLKYPTNDPDDPCNHLCGQNQDEFLYQENDQNNQTNDNEENDTNGLAYSDEENNEIITQQNEAAINNENNEIEIAQNEPTINNENDNVNYEKLKNNLNETEIEFLMLGIDNSISLKVLEKFKSFIDKNKNNLCAIRHSPQYMDKVFMQNFQIKGQNFINENYDHSIFYFEIKKVLEALLNKKHFFERIDFDTDFEKGIYKNYKSGDQFKKLKNKNKIVLLRIFSDSMQCQNKKDYSIMIDIENYIGNEFKKNKLLLFVVPNDWLHNFHQTIRALFSSVVGNGFSLNIENEQIDVVPFGLTMDIPEFRASCKLNGQNSNEYACHTCDKSRDGLFICQSGTLRKQEDINNFHSTKPPFDDLNNNSELKKEWEKKAKEIGIKGVDRGWVEPLTINYLMSQPDILHNILLGVAQRCLNYIFEKYKKKIPDFLNNLKNAKIIGNKPKPSNSLFANKTRKGRENRSILFYLLFSIKNQISNDDFLIMEQLVTICFKLYSDSFDDNDLNSLQVLIESFNTKVNLITETELMNFHLLLHYPIYIRNWGAPKYTSAETFEAQLSRIKNFLNNNTNNRDEQYERVTKLNMIKFFNSIDKLEKIEHESTTLIIGNKIKNPDNFNNIKIKLNSLFKNYKNITLHSSIKNNKEIYHVGDAVEVASDNELSGRWSGIINSISMVEMEDDTMKHAILLNYFEKHVGDQFNKYHFLSNELNYITYDNILNNVIPIQIDDINYLIIHKCHDKFSASKNKKSKN
ncbi:hypothetical protein ACTFIZ_011091 [Dictyostelium cf. discoideum]